MNINVKPFQSLDEQVNILQQRGLIIDDLEEAKRLLSDLNYYRLSGYTLTLRKNNKFYENVHFNEVMQIYYFDMELHSLLLYLLEYIEVTFRSHISYHHTKAYGPLGYLDSSSFIDETRYSEFINDFKKAVNEQGKKEVFIKHHKIHYNNQFPLWVVVEILSFGATSRLFKNLPPTIQKEICSEYYGLIKAPYISNWLQGFTILRNICAHRGRLYNRSLSFGLKLSAKDKKLLNSSKFDIGSAYTRVFTYIFVMKKLVNNNLVWTTFSSKFLGLIEKYPFVQLSRYGFPDDWKYLLGFTSI